MTPDDTKEITSCFEKFIQSDKALNALSVCHSLKASQSSCGYNFHHYATNSYHLEILYHFIFESSYLDISIYEYHDKKCASEVFIKFYKLENGRPLRLDSSAEFFEQLTEEEKKLFAFHMDIFK